MAAKHKVAVAHCCAWRPERKLAWLLLLLLLQQEGCTAGGSPSKGALGLLLMLQGRLLPNGHTKPAGASKAGHLCFL